MQPIHLKIKKCYKYRNDEFIKYETDESSAPLLLNVSMPTRVQWFSKLGLIHLLVVSFGPK